jgi:hypothetical protein
VFKKISIYSEFMESLTTLLNSLVASYSTPDKFNRVANDFNKLGVNSK